MNSVLEVTFHPSERDLPSSFIYLAACVVARAVLRLEGDGEGWGTRTGLSPTRLQVSSPVGQQDQKFARDIKWLLVSH